MNLILEFMPEKNERFLFLSKGEKYLLDEQDNVIAIKAINKDLIYYKMIGVESEAYEKVCKEIRLRKVCVLWNDVRECLLWDDVDVCIESELIPRGFSNIS